MLVILGAFAGFLHVLAGPDHLAAALALRVRRSGTAWYYGGVWAVGHAVGLSAIGWLYFLLNAADWMSGFSLLAERLVGLVLVVVGGGMLLHWRESDLHGGTGESGRGTKGMGWMKSAPLGFGILHGGAGASHVIGLAPMAAFPTPTAMLAYWVAYNMGILLAMVGFCGLVGGVCERALREGRCYFLRLRLATSMSCMVVGSYWMVF